MKKLILNVQATKVVIAIDSDNKGGNLYVESKDGKNVLRNVLICLNNVKNIYGLLYLRIHPKNKYRYLLRHFCKNKIVETDDYFIIKL